MQSTQSTARPRVLRFEFSNAIIDALKAFTEVHRYDDRKTYKEAWAAWLLMEDTASIFKAEVERLTNLGYKGDVADKLFKSGRYYFRTREPTVPHTPPSSAPRTPNDANGVRRGLGNQGSPRKYVLLNHALLDAMDDHIERGLQHDDAYTPAKGFADFCKLNADDSESYRSEVTRLSEIMPKADSDTGKAVHDKLKKTYKNRYFMIANGRTTPQQFNNNHNNN
jgi:hypothetical protein